MGGANRSAIIEHARHTAPVDLAYEAPGARDAAGGQPLQVLRGLLNSPSAPGSRGKAGGDVDLSARHPFPNRAGLGASPCVPARSSGSPGHVGGAGYPNGRRRCNLVSEHSHMLAVEGGFAKPASCAVRPFPGRYAVSASPKGGVNQCQNPVVVFPVRDHLRSALPEQPNRRATA